MNSPYGKARCIQINAQRGKNPMLPAEKLLRKTAVKLRKLYGDGNVNWHPMGGSDECLTDHAACVALIGGEQIIARLYIETRAGVDFFDRGEYATHDLTVKLP